MPPKAKTDAELVQRALELKRAGQVVPQREAHALKRYLDEQREKATGEILQSLSKKWYSEVAHRNYRELAVHQKKYGVPIRGSKINLGEAIRWFHDLLDQSGSRLFSGDDDDPLLGGGNSPALEKCRHEKWLLLQMERKQKEGELVPVGPLLVCHQKLAAILKSCGERLERVYGQDAADMLRDALDSFDEELETILANTGVDADGEDQDDRGTNSGQGEPSQDDG